MKSHWLIIGLISWATRVLFRKPKPWNVFSIFSSRKFSFRLNIEILIHLELTLMGERENQFHPCTCRYPVVPTPFVKDDAFSIMYLFGIFAETQVTIVFRPVSWSSVQFPQPVPLLLASALLFWLLWLRSIIWNQKQRHLQQCFIVYDFGGYLESFVFPFES